MASGREIRSSLCHGRMGTTEPPFQASAFQPLALQQSGVRQWIRITGPAVQTGPLSSPPCAGVPSRIPDSPPPLPLTASLHLSRTACITGDHPLVNPLPINGLVHPGLGPDNVCVCGAKRGSQVPGEPGTPPREHSTSQHIHNQNLANT